MHLSLTDHRWIYDPPNIEIIRKLELDYQLPGLVAKCLAHQMPDAPVEDWLEPTMAHLHDPFLMKGMDIAVQRIEQAVQQNENVLLVTDYDVDGTMSCLVLRSICGFLGFKNIHTYIPDRAEGYGFNKPAIKYAKENAIDLIITADIGVRDHKSVNLAKEMGIDVIICDHHLPPGESVPENAVVVLCPPQDGCTYPNPSLAACGVSFKLAQALLQRHPEMQDPKRQVKILRAWLKVVALGTIADMVSLATMENRAIVSVGLKALVDPSLRNKPGLQALLEVAGVSDMVSSQQVGFQIAPRINAAGRIALASAVEKLFFAKGMPEARKLAAQLDEYNTERKGIQAKMVLDAEAQLPEELPSFIVVGGTPENHWHKGIVGIVAGRLKDKYFRPVAAYSDLGETITGSIRSTEKIHAVRAMDTCKDLLTKYGGHPAAAGFSLKSEDLDEFIRRLNAYVDEVMGGEEIIPQYICTAKCAADEINYNVVQQLTTLEPFGMNNPRPLIWLRDLKIKSLQTLSEGQHLSFFANGIKCLWWKHGHLKETLEQGKFEMLAELGLNRYRGETKIQLTVHDMMQIFD